MIWRKFRETLVTEKLVKLHWRKLRETKVTEKFVKLRWQWNRLKHEIFREITDLNLSSLKISVKSELCYSTQD